MESLYFEGRQEQIRYTKLTRSKKKASPYIVSFLGDDSRLYKTFHKDSHMKVINTLQNFGCFQPVSAEETKHHWVCYSQIIVYGNSNQIKRSHHFVVAYNDHSHRLFITAPTIKRIYLRGLLTTTSTKKLILLVQQLINHLCCLRLIFVKQCIRDL